MTMIKIKGRPRIFSVPSSAKEDIRKMLAQAVEALHIAHWSFTDRASERVRNPTRESETKTFKSMAEMYMIIL
ncbi:hypothetical protein CDAR_42041 [Caerostris darwini]|uniref:Uncharacterized protein n=1 Tax=Caerostris darwini TaxID=1538125 RepID=A0AAV4RFE5_9ARAC|nr:hypothetical protein CDAR_42041 [Caerostris darwini]